VVHSYNPSYPEGRNRRISSLRPVQAKLVRPYLKKIIGKTKRAGDVSQEQGLVSVSSTGAGGRERKREPYLQIDSARPL
jgi:hypothetical protein